MCSEFTPTFDEFKVRFQKYKLDVLEKYSIIQQLLPTKNRKSRSVAVAAAGIAVGVIGLTSAFIQNSRLQALQTSVTELEKRHFLLEDDFIDLKNDMITITQLNANDIDILFLDINQTNYRLTKVADDLFNLGGRYNKSLYEFSSRFQGVKLLSKIVAKALRLINKIEKNFEKLLEHLTEYGNAIVSMLHGHLPRELVSPIVLADIIQHASVQIYAIEPDYTLTFTDIDHYYSYSDLVYSVRDDHLIVVLPLFLRLRTQRPLNLYRLESVYVPTNMSEVGPPPKDYTKVTFNFDYFAVLHDDFLEMTNAVLDTCLNFNNLYICEETVLQIHKSKLTCASAIYADKPVETVNRVCEITYYPKFSPTAQVLESSDSILLANVGTDWRFACTTSNVPRRYIGHPYVILNISSFCHCSLSSESYFISQKITGCDSNLDKLDLRYVINALYVSAIINDTNELLTQLNVNSLFDQIPRVLLPNLDLHADEPLKLHSPTNLKTFLKMGVNLKRNKLHTNIISKQHWYDHQAFTILNTIVSFIVLIIIVTLFVICFKQHKLSVLIPFLSTPSPANALYTTETCNMPIVGSIWVFSMFLMSFVVYRLALSLSRNMTLIRRLCGNNVHHKCVIKLQIVSVKDMVELDMLTINGRLVDVCPDNYIKVNVSELKPYVWYALMYLEIEHNILKLFCTTATFSLPTTVYINCLIKSKLQRIIKDKHACRLVIDDGLSRAIVGQASLRDIWEELA
jgi:hypothetical protein